MGSDEAVDNNDDDNNNNNKIIIIIRIRIRIISIIIIKKLIVGIRLSPEVMVAFTLVEVSLVARSVHNRSQADPRMAVSSVCVTSETKLELLGDGPLEK